jgi:hypothetical protein
MTRELVQMALDALESYDKYPDDAWINQATAIEALRAELAKPEADCNTCANRGRIDGSSQETHCEHCIYQETWRTDHYVRAKA